jgi:PAS domain S-box-containing protein
MSPSAPWRRRASPVILNYGIAILSVAAALAIDVALNQLFGVDPSVSLLLCAIILVAWVGGTGPAILATALTLLAFAYFFLQPTHSFAVQPKEVPRLVLFAIAALFVMWLSAAQRRAAASLKVAHDAQQETVRELQELNEKLRVENTERELAENALRESEAELAKARHEFQLIIDTVPVLILRHRADGIIDFVNQVGRSYSGMVTTNWTSRTSAITHPDDVRPIEQAWDIALATGEPFETEARLRRADGQYRWFATRRVPLRNDGGEVIAWYAATYDIEDRKRAEDALRRSEAYSAEAQKLSKAGSLAWDVPNDVHFWSDETYQIMGFDRSVKPSMDLITQRVHPDDRAHLHHEADRARQGAPNFDYEQRLLMPDGRIKHVHLRAHRVKYESGREEIVGALMDITEARKSQETLHAAQIALVHASRVATLGEISASIAHEVNQPLAAIVANGQACLRFLRRETPDLDNIRSAVGWIVKDGNRAGEVIKRVRGLLKNAGTEKIPLDVNDLINEVAALLRRELAAQEVALQLELAPGVPAIFADRIQLQQVIINLVINGAEAMQPMADRPHGLEIRSYQDETRRVVVAVKDSGVGIPGESADRVFDAFFSTKPGGLGMGLSICRSIVEAHGGRLWASANAGPGTTFQLALPQHRENAA